MSEATARTAVYNAVNGVTDVGQVYDYQRWAAGWNDYINLFKTTIGGTAQVRGWVVMYNGFSTDTPPASFNRSRLRRHRFLIRGYMRVDDSAASEKTFAALAESVANAIDTDSTLHGDSFFGTSDAAIREFVNAPFGDVLCHYAELLVTVTEEYVP